MPRADFPTLLDRVEQGAATASDVSALEQWVEAAPGHVTAHLALARACELHERPDQARRHWRRAALLQPGSPAVRAGLRRTARRPEAEAASLTLPADVLAPERSSETESETGSETETSPEEPSAEAVSELSPREQQQRRVSERTVLQELEAATPEEEESEAHDLDGLIEDLQDARIDPVPDPDDAPDLDDAPAPDLDEADTDDMVSPTLARIYKAQGQHAEAARVYHRLAEEHPAQAEEYRRQAETMEAQARQDE
jgi:tetratricopeptide (TPR) repeat protein